ncbi:MAG: hypothetical protein QQN41_05940 [Nitrosopumilus sp.]
MLFDEGLFWEDELYQEVRPLIINAYKKYDDLQDVLIDKIIQGPSEKIKNKETATGKGYMYKVFEILDELNNEKPKINKVGEKYLKNIQNAHPDWKPRPKMEFGIEVGIDKGISEYSEKGIYSMSPEEIFDRYLKSQNGTNYDRRESSEIIGIRCSREFHFCQQLFELIRGNLNDLDKDVISPLIWGLRPGKEVNQIAWSTDEVNKFVEMIEELIRKRPTPQIWEQIPSLLERYYDLLGKNPDDWSKLYILLRNIFSDFDFDHYDEQKPIDWMQRAINHPFGTLTEIYLKYANRIITEQKESGHNLVLGESILNFFEYIIENHNIGSRYGLCLITQYLTWLENVATIWTLNILLPLFHSEVNTEKKLIAWVGYLWSNVLSMTLIHDFPTTYLHIAKNYDKLCDHEKRGLVGHVAYIFWSKDEAPLKNLHALSKLIGKGGRVRLLILWEDFLEKADEDRTERFWNRVLLPYWNWTSNQRYFTLPTGSDERYGFWKLIPYSYSLFKSTVRNAINYPPEKIERTGKFTEILSKKEFVRDHPKELVNLLVIFIVIDEHPLWQKDEWLQLWEMVRDSRVRNLTKLKDELVKKEIL